MGRKKTIVYALILTLIFTLFPTVTVNASTPKLNKTKVTLKVGETVKLKVTGTKKTITWSSSKKSVATVSKNGKVKAKKPGTAKITAKFGKKKLTCKVTVKKLPEIWSYISGSVFRYKDYGYAKGCDGVYPDDSKQQIDFFFGDGNYHGYFIEVSTSLSTEVRDTGMAYIGIGDISTYDLTYVTGIYFSGNDIVTTDGLTIPRSSIDLIDALVSYMASHPDPYSKPQISGVNFVTWNELYP